MVEIQIQKNQGLTQAIKKELNNQGYDTSKLNGSIWSEVMQEVSNQNSQNLQKGEKEIFIGGTDLNGSGHDNFVVKEGFVELAQNLWNKIVSLVTAKEVNYSQEVSQISHVASTADVNKIKSVPETRTKSMVEPPVQLKQNVEKAQQYLLGELPKLSEQDLKDMGVSVEKRDRIMEYLKNITYDTDHDSAQAVGSGIVFSVNCQDTDNLANMITLLMHEANHCDENYLGVHPEDSEKADLRHRDSNGKPVAIRSVNTKEEEKACETLGLLTTAVLIKNGTLKGYNNYGRYGNNNGNPNPVTSYLTDKNLLKNDIENWVSHSYTNYPEGINNASITVEHLKNENVNLPDNIKDKSLQLKAGDIIKVGETQYTLGGDDGIVLSPLDSLPIFQMVLHGDIDKGVTGRLVFDDLPPCEQEVEFFNSQHNNDSSIYELLNSDCEPASIIRNGKVIYTGKKY